MKNNFHTMRVSAKADNPGIAADEVARDALGLIRQDVRGRHRELLADLLDLLSHLTQSAPPSECSELQGSPLPVALLPVFFNLTVNNCTINSQFTMQDPY